MNSRDIEARQFTPDTERRLQGVRRGLAEKGSKPMSATWQSELARLENQLIRDAKQLAAFADRRPTSQAAQYCYAEAARLHNVVTGA